MSEKEQAEAVKLLHEWLLAARGDAANANDEGKQKEGLLNALIAKTEKFLRLPLPAPESHGQRRS